jgi:repressor LexA
MILVEPSIELELKGVIAAGYPVDPQDGLDDVLELTADLVGDPTNVYALRVAGDSMIEDAVFDGDLVILRHQNTAASGDMVAAWLLDTGETTLKRYYREGRNIRLKAANPFYSDQLKDESQVMVQGKVVAIVRRLA